MATHARAETSTTASLVLSNPYPIPAVYSVTIQKQGTKVGISFSSAKGVTVLLRIDPESPLQGANVKSGQTILAINGIPILDAKQAGSIIREATGNLTFTMAESTNAPYKFVVAPVWRHNPGVNFESTRGRCLVQVSKIFRRGPFSYNLLSKGDLVLVVNGYPVSKPEDADRALQLSRNHPLTIIYAVDISALRRNIIDEIGRSYPVTLRESQTGTYYYFVRAPQGKYKCKGSLHIDKETHELHDPEAYRNLATLDFQDSKAPFRGSYGQYVRPFIQKYNESMEHQLGPLEDFVCCEAWENPVAAPTTAVVAATVSDAYGIPVAEARQLSERGTSLLPPQGYRQTVL